MTGVQTCALPIWELEIEIVMKESGINKETAGYLVTLAEKIRNLKDKGLDEGTGTRALIYAGTLIRSGISEQQAAEVAMANPITDDSDMLRAIKELITTVF